MEWLLGLIGVLVLGGLAFAGWKRASGIKESEKMPATNGNAFVPASEDKVPVQIEPSEVEVPTHIILETATGQEAFSMTMMGAEAVAGVRGSMKKYEPGNFAKAIEPVMQAAPSLITAGMANSKQLMEVVINGPLVAASDGNGLRAMTMGAKGVKEHARLFEATNLQNVANAAAIWQIASVAVAQKHLADISASLKRVEQHVAGIQSILEEERAAVIQSALNYITNVRAALERGEFLERTRDKLEDFEIRLEQAGLALMMQIRRESERSLETDTFGCEGEYESALKKHRAIAARVQELSACAEVRLANWYLCSLYPDRSKLLEGRFAQIKKFSEDIMELLSELAETVEQDCRRIDAKFTSDDTIAQRRGHVRREAGIGAEQLTAGVSECASMLNGVDAIQADRERPTRILVEIEQGMPSAIYMADEKPSIAPVPIVKKERVQIPAPMM